MQAIILAAGMGKRLGELTKDNTKCMVEVNGERLIDRYISILSGYGLTRIIIVTGYKGDNLREYIGRRYDGLVKIEYIDNPIYDKTNNIYSLALAKDALCAEDTILLESDLIFDKKIIDLLINHPDKDLALVAKYESWMDGTMVSIDEDRNIVNFIPKQAFRYEDIDAYWKTVNIYKFSKEFCRDKYVPFLDAYCKVMGNNEYYEQVLRVLTLLHNSPLKALPVNELKWYEIDDVQDLDIASTLFAHDDRKYAGYLGRHGGYWRFPDLLDFSHFSNPYFPTRQMKEELKANFDTLLVSSPSGMAVNALLAGKLTGTRPEYTVVGNGTGELIRIMMKEHCGGRVGMVYPTFDEYPARLDSGQIVSYHIDNKDFTYSADDLIGFFADKSLSMLMLISPDNPTGRRLSCDDLHKLIDWCRSMKVKLLVDESFADFADSGNCLMNNDMLASYSGLYVMKDISSSCGVPGLRIGILASSDKELIARVKADASIWNINSIAEFYLQIHGKYEKAYNVSCSKVKEERQRFFNELCTVPYLRPVPSEAPFIMSEVRQPFTSSSLSSMLLEKGFLIKDCSLKKSMEGLQYVRIAVRSSEDNDRLTAALKEI